MAYVELFKIRWWIVAMYCLCPVFAWVDCIAYYGFNLYLQALGMCFIEVSLVVLGFYAGRKSMKERRGMTDEEYEEAIKGYLPKKAKS